MVITEEVQSTDKSQGNYNYPEGLGTDEFEVGTRETIQIS